MQIGAGAKIHMPQSMPALGWESAFRLLRLPRAGGGRCDRLGAATTGGVDRGPSGGTSGRRLGGQQAGCYGCKLHVRFSFGRLLLSVRAAACAVRAQDEFCTSRILGLVQVDGLARCGGVCAALSRGGAHAAPPQTSWFSSCNWAVLFCLKWCCVGPDFSCAELADRLGWTRLTAVRLG